MGNWKEVRNPGKIEGLRSSVKLTERSLVETCFIATAALECVGEDVSEAKRLLRKAAFRYFGQTWGESLFVTGGGRKLPDIGEVVMTLIAVSKVEQSDWGKEVAYQTVREVIKDPLNFPLYLAQIEDLGGESALALFIDQVNEARVKLPDDKSRQQAKEYYQAIAGLSYWEMEVSQAALFLFNRYTTWKGVMAVYDQAPEHLKEHVGRVLAEARLTVSRLAGVVLSRDMIHPGERMEADNGLSLTYDEILHFLD